MNNAVSNKSVSNLGARIWDLLPGKRNNVLIFLLLNINLEIGALKNVLERFVKQLYLISLNHFLGLPLYFKLKLKSLLESCQMKSFYISKN